MGLDYILIFIVALSVIFYKLNSFNEIYKNESYKNENVKEHFKNYPMYNYLNDDKGFKIILPFILFVKFFFSWSLTNNFRQIPIRAFLFYIFSKFPTICYKFNYRY